jgi:hypothetical protein
MPTSSGRSASYVCLIFTCAALLATGAFAQTSTAPATAQAPAAAPTADDRIKELEDRIIALEGQVRMLQQAKQQPAVAPSQAAASGTAPESTSQAAAQAQNEPVPAANPDQGASIGGASSMAKALNPDISMIGNFVGSAGRNTVAGIPSMEMRESELGVQAIVDPYARADFFISFGEEGVSLEEGYITFTALPAGFVAKVGKMRSAFGKVNTMHSHVLPWIDRPLMTDNLVGGEDGIDDAGFSITRAFAGPKGVYLEATGQVYRGDSADVFEQHQKSDLSTVAHLRGYRDITESTNLDIGVSYARGHNDAGFDTVTSLYGVDATLRWKPLRRSIYHSFIARSEFVWSQRQQFPVEQRAFGIYASADYQLGRRWFMGGRFDMADHARDASLTDKGGAFTVTYWPSEFAQLRGEYRHVNYAGDINADELRMQVMFAIGAHGAHPF